MSSGVQLDKEAEATYQKSKRRVRLEYVNKIKNQPCVDCGLRFPPEAMDFDHVFGEKQFIISRGLTGNFQRLQDEIAKCDVVCACCHRIRTRKRIEEVT
ncbi:hypothetical protein LCGC14_0458280 [marine sediment metagenome]|uniref:HNH domain-containing protein n=1 Tax=marine sediment metagenome TaxID=412755 RepID=A0A0F9SG08_9ZZZZ